MFVCPNCSKEFLTEEDIKKHSLLCWKRLNPDYHSKPAPQGETIITREVDNCILDFFNSFSKE